MKRARVVVGALLSGALLSGALLSGALLSGACLTTYNRPKITLKPGAPALDERPAGCHVDVFESGQKVPRPHLAIGTLVLDWPHAKLVEQGPEGAIRTMQAAACEHGAFLLQDVRALPTGDQGLVYEATLATLLGDDGQPLNLRRLDAGPAPSAPAAPFSSGW